MKRILQVVFFVPAILVAAFILWKWTVRPTISIERIVQDAARLAKQELKFLSRGHDYAHYELTLYSSAGDTVKGFYRVPANTRKLPALIWIYDSKSGVDAMKMLDGIPESAHCAIIAYNCYPLFGHKSDDSLDKSGEALSRGLLKSKRSAELFAQFLKKHHVVDSSLVYAGGEGIGVAAVICAASGSTGRLRGLILTEPEDGRLSRLFAEDGIVSLKTWSGKVIPTPTVVVNKNTTNLNQLLPSHWGCETIGAKPDGTGDEAEIKAALKSGLEWILKAYPVKDDVPGLTDSTKVFNVKK